MSFNSFGFVAGGDIYPSRFVKFSAAADRTLLQAGANEQTMGVSQDFARAAPTAGASALAAAATQDIGHSPIGSYAKVEAGSGGVTRGDLVKSDTDGKAVTVALTGATVQWVAGRAIESAAAGELAEILVESYPWRPALS